MLLTSDWPLPPEGTRFFVPDFIVALFTENVLCKDLYPLRFGYYPKAQGHNMVRDEHHGDHLLIYCLDGEADLVVEGRHHKVSKGCLVLLPKDSLHSYSANKSNPWTIFWIHFDGELSQAYLDNLNYSFETPIIRLGVLPRLVSGFESLLAVSASGFGQKVYIHIANHLKQLLTYIAIQIPKAKAGESKSLNLDEVHGLMQHNLHGQIDLDLLAAKVNLSKYYFSKKYKELTGRSPIQHFIHLKMEHACYLLDVSTQHVNEIARELGYDDAYYFSRLFKKVVGMSPSEYKRVRYR